MKRVFLLLVIFFTLSSLSSYAGEIEIATPVLQSFNNSFKNASDVKWTTVEDYFKAEFIFNGQQVCAFYDHDGKMIAITRHILSTQLPISLQADLRKDYEDCWISELFELNNDQGTTYFITLEKADVRVILKSNSGNG